MSAETQHTTWLDAHEIRALVDGVPVHLVRQREANPPPDCDEIIWLATVSIEGQSYTAVVNSREDAETVVVALAAKVKEIEAAKRAVRELEHEMVHMANQITRLATQARKPPAEHPDAS